MIVFWYCGKATAARMMMIGNHDHQFEQGKPLDCEFELRMRLTRKSEIRKSEFELATKVTILLSVQRLAV